MDFSFSKEQMDLREQTYQFAKKVVEDHIEELDSGEFPRNLWAAYQREGLLSRTLPRAFGGQGRPFLDMVLTLEQLARVHPTAAAYLQTGANFPIEFISRLGSEHLKKTFLPRIESGEALLVQALSEPGAGSALTDLKTTAVRDGENYLVNGLKHYITYGFAATGMVVFARFDGSSRGAKGIGAIVVEKGTPGYECVRKQPNLSAPKGGEAIMRLDNCIVPAVNVLVHGDANSSQGFAKLINAYNSQRVGNAAICLGVAQRALELAARHAKNRRQFGRPIADFQVIQHYIAEMSTKIEASRLLVYRAATNAAFTASGLPDSGEAAYAKLFANQMVFEVADKALQIFGGAGYIDNSEIGKLFLFARGESIAGGTIEMQKNLIASTVLERKIAQRHEEAAQRVEAELQ